VDVIATRLARLRGLPEFEALVLEYQEEIGDTPDPDWPEMRRLEAVRDLFTFAVLDGEAIGGFAIVRLMPVLAHRGQKIALADFIYIKPEHRGTGTRQLIETIIGAMRGKATKFVVHHGIIGDAVFPPLGHAACARIWSRDIE
jgi:GNAT superfamily N-acetyltransferase